MKSLLALLPWSSLPVLLGGLFLLGLVSTKAQLDDSWTVMINGQSVRVNKDGSFRISNIAAPDTFGPGGPGTPRDFLSDEFFRVVGLSASNGAARYAVGEFFQLAQGRTVLLSNMILSDLPVVRPESLRVVPVASSATNATPLRVTALYTGGATNDVSGRSRFTSYRTSNSRVAMVDEEGVVTLVGLGRAYITTVHQGAAAVTELVVPFGDSRTTVEGFVRLADGTPAAGVTVRLLEQEGYSAVTDAQGHFSIGGVQSAYGTISVAIQVRRESSVLVGFARQLSPRPGGITDAGLLTLRPLSALRGRLAGGFDHTMALKADGTRWGWGANHYGQLGDGTNYTAQLQPKQIGQPNDWSFVDAGDHFTLALKTNGTLWAWGSGYQGRLGDGAYLDRLLPVPIGTNNDWASVSAGDEFAVGLRKNGSLWSWGRNSRGQLGNGTGSNAPTPTRVGTNGDWLMISAGREHAMALKTDGSLWGWGFNFYGQVGNGGVSPFIPDRVGVDYNWLAVECGSYHTVAIQLDGSLWAWGENFYSQVGDGTTQHRNRPVRIGLDTDWAMISGGADFTLALKLDGSLWGWGQNSQGQYGDGTGIPSTVPKRIGLANDWLAIEAGQYHALALKQDGSLWTWGRNVDGQTGDGTAGNNRLQALQIGTDHDWGPPP